MSPVSTATRSPRGHARKVLSSRLVLPEPGALIKLRHSTPCSRKRSRNSAAWRSFSPRTFFSSATRFMLGQLQKCQFQLIAAYALATGAAALRTRKIKIFHHELGRAVEAAMAARASFNFQLEPLEFGVEGKGFEGEAQGFGIDRRQLANAHGNLDRPGARVAGGLSVDGFEHGLCYP